MKYFVRQVEPKLQTCPFKMFGLGIVFKGNPHYIDHYCSEWDYALRFIRRANTYSYLDLSDKELRQNIEEDIPREKGYSDEDVDTIRSLIADYQTADTTAKENSAFIGILNIFTSRTWVRRTIRGCCQGEWQIIYYPEEEFSDQDIKNIEIEYFDMGYEWIVHDQDNTPEKPEDVTGYSVYTHGWNTETNRKELAEYLCCEPEDIVMWEYDHDKIIPLYRKAA